MPRCLTICSTGQNDARSDGMLSDLPERIRSRIFLCCKKDLSTPCWLWTGAHSGRGKGGGYGRVSWLGRTVAVHRLVFFLIRGRWPWKRQLDHLCETRACCNPDHLEPVTNRVNNRRRVRRSKALDKYRVPVFNSLS